MNINVNSLQAKLAATVMSLSILAAGIFIPVNVAQASSDHGHAEEEEHHDDEEGPHGGRLLKHDDFALEMTMAESGIPPEMRVYAFYKGEAVAPSEVELTLSLTRLGGVIDSVSFIAEEGYLVSQHSVAEPHSFDVEIDATYKGKDYDFHYENHMGRVTINDRLLALSGVKTGFSTPAELRFVDHLFGVVAAITDKQFSVSAPYTGVVEQLNVTIGDNVVKGQVIATVRNSTTLQRYSVKSPANGQVTELMLSVGDSTFNQALLLISDLSSVWIDMSAFPKNLSRIALGQAVTIGDDDHDNSEEHRDGRASSTISYIAPVMTGGHIARVRAVIANPEGHWRPGMHIQANVETRTKQVPLAVRADALQTFMDKPAVFVKYGNTFEVRLLTLGETDGQFVEVLAGLEANAEYVTENSYLLKADIMKNAAKHVH
ncbi:efflux RND transporter periplasmic adaptor subunit [Shewanella abyssi]|uniref:efflux RND transporter periplasmic adaptor subunit n=1 Tax=Shewanella abyssi TaxID=311789 RepID=UPI00200CD889|nr:efflux RND transporter periplasmic adaptor subunit [Shewanella abyssi]MCL1050795.1 efflux RND transporter periplasmic adaptor subunit [Shewanella abyssi]